MKRPFVLLAACAALFLVSLGGTANAQPRPQGFYVTAPQVVPTYAATAVALTPVASWTDIIQLSGSATRVVHVKSAKCMATATAASSYLLLAMKRTTADSGSTPVAMTTVSLDSNNPAATAAITAFGTSNATLGTGTATVVGSSILTTVPLATPAVVAEPAAFIFNGLVPGQDVVLHGVAQQFVLNGNGASMTSGAALTCTITWTESGV